MTATADSYYWQLLITATDDSYYWQLLMTSTADRDKIYFNNISNFFFYKKKNHKYKF